MKNSLSLLSGCIAVAAFALPLAYYAGAAQANTGDPDERPSAASSSSGETVHHNRSHMRMSSSSGGNVYMNGTSNGASSHPSGSSGSAY